MDAVNHPQHYTGFSNGSEVIDITENLSFNLGNVVKYVARAGRKDPNKLVEDLRKAEFYLNRELTRLTVGAIENYIEDKPRRAWNLLDHVPPNTIVEDRDGDRYRRINGTAKFEIATQEDDGRFNDWRQVWPWIYRDQDKYGPFTEVSE